MRYEQSIRGCEAYFLDLAEAFSEITGTEIIQTLNFRENPRWGVFQKRIKEYGVFGRDISQETGLCASDHYGVYVELEF